MKQETVHVFDSPLNTDATSDVVNTWMNMMGEGTLSSSHIREFLFTKIPGLYELVSSGASFSRLEEAALPSTLIGYLEEFIFNGEKEQMEDFGTATLPCGKAFKNGEPSYNCRECSTDQTCVLCVECFQNSGHRFHRYRMATSTGGGYCDCGDKEAWKNFPYCETHQPSLDSEPPASASFPPDIFKRSKIVFSTVLHISHEVINRLYCADVRTQRPCSNDRQEKYLLFMYNDEIHTFEHVIDLLVKVVKCSRREGLEIASKINNEGRAIIIGSDYETCSKMKSKIESMSTIGATKFLEVHIIPFHVVAIQCFALYNLLEWLKSLLKTSHCFRSALVDVFQELDGNEVSFLLDEILVQDPLLWKYARMQWNSVLCSGFLPDYDSKKILATRYIANYPKIMENYMKDEEDHTYSTAGLSVQLFTVPSIAKELIGQYRAIESIMGFISRVSIDDRDDQRPGHQTKLSRLSEQASYLLYDVRYLLCSPPSSIWTEELRIGFCRGMNSFLDFLGLIEGMQDFTRQLGEHIEFELKWERAFNLQLKCFPVISQSLKWCTLDEAASTELFKATIEKHRYIWRHVLGSKTWLMIGTKFKVRCMKFDATENGISIHLPLTRFWGALFFIRMAQDNFSDLIVDLPILDLMEPVMRTRAMIAQVRVGMWRKNGPSVSSSVFFYHTPTFRAKTLDMDIKLLQIGASLIGSNDFMMSLIYKFGLLKWSQLGDESTCDLPETDNNQIWALVDEFLYLIIVMTAERFEMGVGDVTLSDCVKYKLIHELALEPKSHSELSKGLGADPGHEVHVEAVLREIATFRSANETSGNGHYELNDFYHPNFNVFFYHYNKVISFKTERVQKARHKVHNGLECCPPPILPPFLEPFSKVTNLLNSDVMIHIMELVLCSWIEDTIQDTLDVLHKIVFLIGLALLEEESMKNVFLFTVKTKASRILKMMLNIYCSLKLKDHRDLLRWVLQKFGSLTNDESVEAAMLDYEEKEKMEKQLLHDTKLRALQSRAKIMDNMKRMQTKFKEKFLEPKDVQDVAVREIPETGRLMCILCQEEESMTMGARAMVYIGLVQLSTVHMRDRQPFAPEDLSENLLTSKMGPSAFLSTCGHVMHADCWDGWRTDTRRSAVDHQPTPSHDPQKEFLCPLCQSISNVGIPILPLNLLERLNPHESSGYNCTFIQWLEITFKLLQVEDISKRNSRPEYNLEHLSEWETTDLREPPTLNPSDEEASSLHEPVSGASGYNLPFDLHRMLNIGCLSHVKSLENEPEWFEVDDEKLNWVLYMETEIHKVVTPEQFQKMMETDRWDYAVVWKMLAYTICSIEMSLRYEEKPLFSGLLPRQEACLTNLIKIAYVLSVHKEPRDLRMGANQWALTLLEMIIRHEGDTRYLLEWDCFGVLVALLIVTPNLIIGSSELMPSLESFLLRLMLISKMAQILLTLDIVKYSTGSPKMTGETACLQFLVNLLRHECIAFDTDAVWEEFKERAKPFLRCCAIFFHFKCPERFENYSQLEDSYENLAGYLKIPSSCKELVDENLTQSLFVTWGEHPRVRDFCTSDATKREVYRYIMKIGTVRINSLVELPPDYSTLLNRVRDFSCPNSDINDSPNPTMCLICGKILCSLSYCCQTTLHKQKVGACTFHAYECGGGTGIFLRVRDCQLILFAGVGRGCFHPPPYLDEHHESDQGLRRGNKLLLSEERYKRLQLAWINHNLMDLVTRGIEKSGLGRWELF